MERYEHLQRNPLDTAYGVDGMVRERRQAGERAHTAQIATGGAVLAVYLLASFVTMDWAHTWIVWPVAGVAYAVFSTVVGSRR